MPERLPEPWADAGPTNRADDAKTKATVRTARPRMGPRCPAQLDKRTMGVRSKANDRRTCRTEGGRPKLSPAPGRLPGAGEGWWSVGGPGPEGPGRATMRRSAPIAYPFL